MKALIPIFTSAVTLSLLSVPAQAQYSFQSWNENDDNRITKAEWNTGIDKHDVFEELDDNNSGIFEIEESDENFLEYNTDIDIDDDFNLERNEVAAGLFRKYDADNSEWLSEAEFSDFSKNLHSLLM